MIERNSKRSDHPWPHCDVISRIHPYPCYKTLKCVPRAESRFLKTYDCGSLRVFQHCCGKAQTSTIPIQSSPVRFWSRCSSPVRSVCTCRWRENGRGKKFNTAQGCCSCCTVEPLQVWFIFHWHARRYRAHVWHVSNHCTWNESGETDAHVYMFKWSPLYWFYCSTVSNDHHLLFIYFNLCFSIMF